MGYRPPDANSKLYTLNSTPYTLHKYANIGFHR